MDRGVWDGVPEPDAADENAFKLPLTRTAGASNYPVRVSDPDLPRGRNRARAPAYKLSGIEFSPGLGG